MSSTRPLNDHDVAERIVAAVIGAMAVLPLTTALVSRVPADLPDRHTVHAH